MKKNLGHVKFVEIWAIGFGMIDVMLAMNFLDVMDLRDLKNE